jgi:hypothetical protein
VGAQAPPTRVAPSLVRALRDARGPLLCATWTSRHRRSLGHAWVRVQSAARNKAGQDSTGVDTNAKNAEAGIVEPGRGKGDGHLSASQRATTSAACRHNGAESASQLDSGRVSRIVPSFSS